MLRVLIDQAHADREAGLNTAGLISGYPGSPLGGVDLEMLRNRTVFEAAGVHHQLGLNEELAATAIFGTQLIHDVPGARFDGVFGMWFGKAPGVDRAADALHHANFHGVGKNGGVLVVAGDDPHARSTILPTDSNAILASFYMPVLAPGNVQEVIDFGRHGYAMSRAAGLWVGFKLVADVADSIGTAAVGLDRVQPVIPEVRFDGEVYRPSFRPKEVSRALIEREREILYAKFEIARQYARLNGLNRVLGAGAGARRGIVAGGKTYFDLREALRSVGLDDAGLAAAGIRLLKMGMVHPFDETIALEFAEGLEDILVVEDKRPFLEDALKAALYGRPGAPTVVGKNDAAGTMLLTACGELSSDAIRDALVAWLGLAPAHVRAPARFNALPESRTPYFCSGCPHNRSLKVPEGSVVGAGIGCHIMTLWMGSVMGDVTGYTQMGGEGAQWVGLSRFTDTRHFFQNLGDGTYSHSGSLAIRFAVAAGTNITYKILYNSAVAMTGGQDVFGGKTVPNLVRELLAEGVRKIVVTTDAPERYRGMDLGADVSVRHRDELLAVEQALAATPGVTVLINDQQCAAEKRRLRKRGHMEQPVTRVVINERICEGCGDCGVKSNCLSVEPVQTEFGRKTRINQTSCNQDYSCLLGDCPSFMTVAGDPDKAQAASVVLPDIALVDPVPVVPEDSFSVFMAGIGGTGVVTVNQVLGMAAALAGRSVRGIDQIGSSQKAGPVVSHLRIATSAEEGGNRIMGGQADLYLAFDMLAAAEATNLELASPERTVLVANVNQVPTGGLVTDVRRARSEPELLRGRLASVTRPDGHYIDMLAVARQALGDEVAANMVLVGAAYQAGALPLPGAAIEAAITMNGVAVEANVSAFRWGRLMVQAPDRVAQALGTPTSTETIAIDVPAALDAMLDALKLDAPLAERVRMRLSELCRFQDSAYAQRYLAFVAEVAARSSDRDLVEAVALNLYKLMAYKDEYEVARLLVEAHDRRSPTALPTLHWHLHPAFLRHLGVRRKVKLGHWFLPFARMLASMKRLRGTWFDIFGKAELRGLERALITEYVETIRGALATEAAEPALLRDLARLPDMIRGYEDIKLRNVEEYQARRAALLDRLKPARVAG